MEFTIFHGFLYYEIQDGFHYMYFLLWNSRVISMHVKGFQMTETWKKINLPKKNWGLNLVLKVWDINEIQDLTTQITGPCLTSFIFKIWPQSFYIINTFWTLRNSLSVWRDTAHVMVSRHTESEVSCHLITFLPPFLFLSSTLFPPSSSSSFLLYLLSSTHLRLVFTDLLAS